MKNSFDKSKLMDALVKRAEGFFYTEEVCEYSLDEVKIKDKKNAENIDEINNDSSLLEMKDLNKNKSSKKNSKKSVSKNIDCENDELYFVKNEGRNNKKCDGVVNENIKDLMLIKKKVTTHYIPPDLSAIKMLIENFGQEMKSTKIFDEMSDEELLSMREEILKDIGKAF